MRWEMLTDAKATSHPGTASVVCRDMVRKENETLETDRELAVYHEGNHRHVVTSHAIRLTNR